MEAVHKKWEIYSTSKLHANNGLMQFWKLWLNLCSFKWLRPNCNLINKRSQAKLQTLKVAEGCGWIRLSKCCLNILKINLRISKSSLFHSGMVHGKKEFLNESVLQWYVGISSKFRVLYERDSWGINWKRRGRSPEDLNL